MPSILVIDDDHQICHLIRDALEQAGYAVEETHEGKEGMNRYRANRAAVVLMDLFRPNQDGLESIRILRHEFPASRVIAMTEDNNLVALMKFLKIATVLGACRTLVKPFELTALLDAVAAEAPCVADGHRAAARSRAPHRRSGRPQQIPSLLGC